MNSAISFLILLAAFTWLLMLITGCCLAAWLLWRRRGLRRWLAEFDRGLEREERIRAVFQRRHRFRP